MIPFTPHNVVPKTSIRMRKVVTKVVMPVRTVVTKASVAVTSYPRRKVVTQLEVVVNTAASAPALKHTRHGPSQVSMSLPIQGPPRV
jgi:hypothetical protein